MHVAGIQGRKTHRVCHSWGFLEGSTVEAVLTHGVERKTSRGCNLQKTQSNICADRCSSILPESPCRFLGCRVRVCDGVPWSLGGRCPKICRPFAGRLSGCAAKPAVVSTQSLATLDQTLGAHLVRLSPRHRCDLARLVPRPSSRACPGWRAPAARLLHRTRLDGSV